jgi:hypothetical protein
MTLVNRSPYALLIVSFFMLLALLAPPLNFGQTVVKKAAFDCPEDEGTAVRFFYHDEENYFHFPLIVRPVASGDPRLGTAPMVSEGRTAYISMEEMQQLLKRLMLLDLSWQVSKKTEVLGSYKRLYRSDRMGIVIVCSKGTARANLDPKKICDTLATLDEDIKTPRALWEFQLFRTGYSCSVPGFDYHAYPDR